ncbi:MAG: hypothetical protein ACYCQJ_06095 [Nitrososphaerales archaeon]
MSTVIKSESRKKEKIEEEEEILGTFSSTSDPKRGTSYSIYITNKRIIGLKIHPGLVAPKKAKDIDSLGTPVDFEIPRGAILRVTMKNVGTSRNLFVVQMRSGGAIKILLRHSTNQEFQKIKDLLIDGFQSKS